MLKHNHSLVKNVRNGRNWIKEKKSVESKRKKERKKEKRIPSSHLRKNVFTLIFSCFISFQTAATWVRLIFNQQHPLSPRQRGRSAIQQGSWFVRSMARGGYSAFCICFESPISCPADAAAATHRPLLFPIASILYCLLIE